MDWNINSITWNPTSLDNGKVQLDVPTPNLTTLTLQAGLDNGSGGQVEIRPNIVLGAFQTWNDATGIDVFGTISGAGGIQKTGSGTLRLIANTNSYSGGTTIADGALEVSNNSAPGTANSIQLDNGTLRFASYSGPSIITVVLDRNLILGVDGGTIQTVRGDVTFHGLISGGGQLRLDPDSSRTSFTQSRYTFGDANTYTGGTVLGAVTVNITGTGQSLGTGGVTVKSDGVLALSAETNLAPGQKVALKTGGVLVLSSAAINPANIIDAERPAESFHSARILGARSIWRRSETGSSFSAPPEP